jgi:hypothetical protein
MTVLIMGETAYCNGGPFMAHTGYPEGGGAFTTTQDQLTRYRTPDEYVISVLFTSMIDSR